MARRDPATSARILALTRAAYAASEAVAPWDVEGDPPPSAEDSEQVPTRGRRRPKARRRLTARTALAIAACAAILLAAIVVRTVSAGASTVVVPPDGLATGPPEATAVGPDESASPSAPDDSPTASAPAEVVVHVAGEVVSPGLVRLPVGSRVADAVAAAGGAGPNADLDAVNLARVLVDGEQVYLPAPGESVPATSGQGGGAATGSGVAAALINLNQASAAELEELPGIGPSLAARIVAWREEHGGFQDVAELDEVSGIGPSLMAQLTPLVTL